MTMQSPGPDRLTTGERFDRWLRRGVARRGAFPLLAGAVVVMALGAGALARLTAEDEFGSYGDATWWALVTLTTVGYGDIVPESAWGRMIGVFVMVLGVTFISFLTATVTSIFITSDEGERDIVRKVREAEVRATLQRIEDRLEAIEARLGERA